MGKVSYYERGLEVKDDGTILLIRCPKCDLENYALNVLSGICTWCGYNAHKDNELKQRAEEWINSKKKTKD